MATSDLTPAVSADWSHQPLRSASQSDHLHRAPNIVIEEISVSDATTSSGGGFLINHSLLSGGTESSLVTAPPSVIVTGEVTTAAVRLDQVVPQLGGHIHPPSHSSSSSQPNTMVNTLYLYYLIY